MRLFSNQILYSIMFTWPNFSQFLSLETVIDEIRVVQKHSSIDYWGSKLVKRSVGNTDPAICGTTAHNLGLFINPASMPLLRKMVRAYSELAGRQAGFNRLTLDICLKRMSQRMLKKIEQSHPA